MTFDVFPGSCSQSTVHDLTVHRATPEDIVSLIAVTALSLWQGHLAGCLA